MTDQPIDPEVHVQRPGDGGLAGSIAPEGVAGALAIVAVVVILAARLAFAGGSGPGPTPRPTPAFTPAPTIAPGSALAGTIARLRQVDANLGSIREDLVLALKASSLDVRGSMAAILAQLDAGNPAAAALAATPEGASVGTELVQIYAQLGTAEATVHGVILREQVKWRTATQTIVDTLVRLEAIDAELGLLLSGPAPSSPPSSSPGTSPSTGPSPSLSPTPTEQPSIQPTLPPPSSSPSPTASVPPSPGPNAVLDPGFETGAGAPWALVLNDPAAGASVAGDTTNPHAGTTSARIDISATPGRQSAISFQQGNIVVEAGAQYRVTLWARSSSMRDMRVRVTTSAGQTLGNATSQFTIGPAWTPLTFDFSSILGTTSAIVAIEVGNTAETVWIDDVGIARVPSGAP